MFQRVLVANRGEIAVRIIRTLREMGIVSVAAYSDADRDALFVLEADEAYRLGESPASHSYLNVKAILDVARQAKVQAVHPGYGFLSEDPTFAMSVSEAGMIFIGPPAEAIRLMGDKIEARRAVARLGVPTVPGSDDPIGSLHEAVAVAERIGFPLAVKAAGGGGGRGIRIVHEKSQLVTALETVEREARRHFKRPDVYLERYFPSVYHVEFQVLGDTRGCLVHLGERDCSLQRRHQKLLEETPSPQVDAKLRQEMGDLALQAARSAGYSSAGTVEFLLTPEKEFFFLEMNTRIQVEHPITEAVAGVDLVREMVLVAAGEPISIRDNVMVPNGHAVEVRVNAEDATADFQPTPAQIVLYREPGGVGIRLDSGVYQGYTIPPHYDSLIAKVIAWAPDREQARARMLRALREFVIKGPSNTMRFAEEVLRHPMFCNGAVNTTFVEEHWNELAGKLTAAHGSSSLANDDFQRIDGRQFDVEVNRKLFRVRVTEVDGRSHQPVRRQGANRSTRASGNMVQSPMHGTVVAIRKQPGDAVSAGEAIFTIEAMKMENEVTAHRAGTLESLLVTVGDTVDMGQALAEIN